MASSKEYRDYVLEQMELLKDITVRPMMGEYLLYCGGTLFGGIYDDRLLVKKTESNAKYGMPEAVPYEGAKPMFCVEAVDDREALKKIVTETCLSLTKKVIK